MDKHLFHISELIPLALGNLTGRSTDPPCVETIDPIRPRHALAPPGQATPVKHHARHLDKFIPLPSS